MRKSTIVKLFVGSLIGFGAAIVLGLVAAALALWSGTFIMSGPDVVGVRPNLLGSSMIILTSIALLAIVVAGVVQFIAWIGAVLNTAELADKTWCIVLLVLGLFSLGLPAMIAYVVAGPDGVPAGPAQATEVTQPTQDQRVAATAS